MYIKTKKSLSQNFLIDREVLEKIVSTTNITNKEVLEIGPGSGNLTTYILKQKPKKYTKDSICIVYYKGTKPTTDKEKIETAQ